MDISTDSIQSMGTRKGRSSRTALGDISNKIKSGITEVAKKVTSTKKRKSEEPVLVDNSQDIVALTENPMAKASKLSHVSETDNTIIKSLVVELKVEPSRRRFNRMFPIHLKGCDPAHCLDTIDEMYSIYYELETKHFISTYMPTQTDINYKMRSILVDWLVEVHNKFKLQASTLWLCVNILDRYLEKTNIVRSKLQLVGVTSLFIACKFEELFPPEVRDCVYITDFAYDREEVLKMESTILGTLNYDIMVPTGHHFLARYLNCIKASERTRILAAYYAERNLQESDMLLTKPHLFAAAAVYGALRQQNSQYPDCDRLAKSCMWPRVLQEETGLTEDDVYPSAVLIVKHVSEEPQTTSKRKLIATKKKYGNDKYLNVAALPLPNL